MDDNRHGRWNFAILSLFSFLVLMLEYIVCLFQKISTNPNQISFSQIILHWIITCIVWGIAAYTMHFYSKKRLKFNLFDYKEKPNEKELLLSILILLFATVIMTVSWNFQFKPLAEYTSYVDLYGKMGGVAFLFQYIYYCFEAVLIVWTIAFGQKAGELIFKNKYIPWGGIVCGITWGLPHLFTNDLAVGILGFLVSIFYGVTYLLVKKNIRYAYPLIFLMFVL
jgi:hypothetical protein